MKTITFTSHYNKTQLNIRLADDKVELLTSNQNYEPFELYINDCERVNAGHEPKYFSMGQIKKLQNYLPGIDVWASLEIINA